jgi:CRP/FNR family transcriptional regulator, cyclic AMP receptor protein
MTSVNLPEIVRPGSLLSDLPAQCLERLAPAGRSRQLDKGQTLFQKGDPGDFLAVVLEGSLKISTFSIAGTETVLNLLQPGDVVGELAAIDGHERSADAVALEASRLLTLSRESLNTFLRNDAEFAAAMTRALCGKLRSTSDALESTTMDMGRRVAASLLRLAEQNGEEDEDGRRVCEIAIDQSTLARYAGLSRSNLNRVLKRFERAGASRHEKGILSIIDPDWLEDYAASED